MKQYGLTELPKGPVRIFAVLRDGRGGVDFREAQLSIPFISEADAEVADDARCFDVRGAVK